MTTELEKWKIVYDSEDRSSSYDKIIDLFSLRRVERFKVIGQLLLQASLSNFANISAQKGT